MHLFYRKCNLIFILNCVSKVVKYWVKEMNPSDRSRENLCELCATACSERFCCPGCRAVFTVLQAKDELKNYRQSAVFQQALRSGLISNSALLQQLQKEEEQDLCKLYLHILDMWCPSCAEVIQWILLKTEGVTRCSVDYATDIAIIEFAPKKIGKEHVVKKIGDLGYQSSSLEEMAKVDSATSIRLIIATFCALNIMMFSYPIYTSFYSSDPSGYTPLFVWLSMLFSLPVVTYCLWPFAKRALAAVKVGIYGMESLVTIAVLASFVYSLYQMWIGSIGVYFDAMAVIVSFVLAGKLIEAKAKFRAKESLLQLARYLPKRVRRIEGAKELFVPIKEVKKGDYIAVITGEKIPLEGVVVEGEAVVDESAMTGESLPVVKQRGSALLSGTILTQGKIIFEVTTTFAHSLLQQIVAMVERDLHRKEGDIRAADRIASYFVPMVVAIAFSTALFVIWFGITDRVSVVETAFLRSIAVLLISCPCAIGIAAPLAESLLMRGLASKGAIVRNRGSLRFLGAESAVVFDKTGTITTGCFTVQSGLELPKRYLQIIKALSSQSIHPLALALLHAIDEAPAILKEVKEHAGRGMSGMWGEELYLLGSERLLEQYGIACDLPPSHSTVYFADARRCITAIVLQDRLRSSAYEAVKSCFPAKSFLLSGDASSAVRSVATQCGFTDWRARFSPLEKREFIRQLREEGEIVMMVGDGINDAPALSSAHVGISVVSATDLSIQVSDILLTKENLTTLQEIGQLAVKTRHIISQNLLWAFSYNVVGIFLAIVGLLTPIYSAIIMILSSFIVVVNTMRIFSNKCN